MWNDSSWSKSYTFSCAPIANWTTTAYPTCTLTCNSWYNKSGNSCVKQSSWGWGSSWGSGWGSTDYENVKYISKSKIKLIEQITGETEKIYWILDLSEYEGNQLTWDKGIINIKTSYKWVSKIIIPENTNIVWDSDLIYAPYSSEIKYDLKKSTLKINNKDLPSYNIKKIFFAWNTENPVSFNKEVWVEFNLWSEITWAVYVYHSDDIDWNFSLFKKWLKTDEDWIVSFKTNKLGYFAFIRDIYVERYFGTQTTIVKNINTKTNTEELVTLLKAQINNSSINTYIDNYVKALIIPEMEYYINFDPELQTRYNSIVKWYTDFIINIDKYITTKDSKYQVIILNAFKEYSKISSFKDFENRYIIETERDWLEIYKTKYLPLSRPLDILENAVMIKLQKLLNTNTITQATYDQTIKDYNAFILHLSIYKIYWNKSALYEILAPGRRLEKVYKMNVVYKTTESSNEIQDTEKVIILVKDRYYFPSELKFWDYNEYVRNLQTLLKSYWYFTHPTTTKYFWNVTKASFTNFAIEVLKLDNTNWVLTKEAIEKMYLLEYKD